MSYPSCFGARAHPARPGSRFSTTPIAAIAVEPLEDRLQFSAIPQVAITHGVVAPPAAHAAPATTSPDKGAVAHYYRKVHAKPAYVPAVTDNAPSDFFPIGVWYQPAYLLNHWAGVGVNTAVGYENEGGAVSLDWWRSYAQGSGLKTIRQPSKNPADDASDPSMLAWLLGDEPDLHGVNSKALQNQYKSLKAVDSSMLVFVNFDGSRVLKWQGKMSSKGYQAYLQAADWSGSDIYPVTGWNQPNALTAPGDAAYTLGALSGGKPQFAFIETSDQNLPWLPKKVPGPSPAQVRAEIWGAINRGARGIVYFPQQIGGFAYDATPQNVLNEIKLQNARLTAIGGALESPLDPDGMTMHVAQPLEGSYRSYNGKSYFIVTNMSKTAVDGSAYVAASNVPTSGYGWANVTGENRGVSISNGTFADHFGACETHVYVVG